MECSSVLYPPPHNLSGSQQNGWNPSGIQVNSNLGVTTSNNSDFTVVIVTVGSASGSLKAEPKECLTGKGQVLSKGLRA